MHEEGGCVVLAGLVTSSKCLYSPHSHIKEGILLFCMAHLTYLTCVHYKAKELPKLSSCCWLQNVWSVLRIILIVWGCIGCCLSRADLRVSPSQRFLIILLCIIIKGFTAHMVLLYNSSVWTRVKCLEKFNSTPIRNLVHVTCMSYMHVYPNMPVTWM